MPSTLAIARRTAVLFVLSTAAGMAAEGQDDITYQINLAHSGRVSFSNFDGRLKPLWTQNLGVGAISYPLIADGLVFVTAANAGGAGTELFALDATTGAVAWQQAIAGSHHWSNAAYENGQVFVVNFNGVVQAFAAGTGALNWSVQMPGETEFSSPPASQSGFLYLTGTGNGGMVYEVDDGDGSVLWTAKVHGGAHSSPVLGVTGVSVTYACQYYKFSVTTGDLIWHDDEGCNGSGGRTGVWYKSLLFVRDPVLPNSILNDNTGEALGTFAAQTAPAFFTRSGQDFGVSLANGTLSCFSTTSGNSVWSFAGDGQMTTAPIVVGGYVVEGSASGNLYVLNDKNGKLAWSANVGTPIPAPDENSVSQPLTGLGAGDGVVVIPTGTQLFAYGPR